MPGGMRRTMRRGPGTEAPAGPTRSVIRGRTRKLGQSAERLALDHLRQQGLAAVDKNFRTRRGEIDLVMLDGHCLVFVEVRYRTPRSYVRAAETVDHRKRSKLTAAAAQYLAAHDEFRFHTCRFDVVGIDRHASGDICIDWRRDAFRPEDRS